ncbi:unnamed protein product, partial [Brenthis ino]
MDGERPKKRCVRQDMNEKGAFEEDDVDVPEQDDSCQQKNESYSDYSYITPDMAEVGEASTPKQFNYEEDKFKRHYSEVDDEYDAIGINVAAKLRGLPPNMRILAEKLINDVLYQAQMNALNSSTVISTLDPFK